MYKKYNFYNFTVLYMTHSCDMSMKMWGNVTVGPKGQIVIPKEVRDLLDIHPWDSLVTISKWNIAVWFIKNGDMQSIMEYMQEEMKACEEKIK